MPQFCSVRMCNKTGGPNFPKDKIRLKQWLTAIRRERYAPENYSIVCRNHVIQDDYELPKFSVLDNQDPLALPEPEKPKTPDHVAPAFSTLPDPIDPIVTEDDDCLCKDCAEDIDGFSWWCVQCSGGALCGACAVREPHDKHYVLRAPRGATHSQTQTVLAVIRQQLQKENLLTLYEEDTIRLEIKLEAEETSSPLAEPPVDLKPALDPKLDSSVDPKLDSSLDPKLDSSLDTALETVMEPMLDDVLDAVLEPDALDPLTTVPSDAGKAVAETEKEETVEEYLAKRQRLIEYINKPFSTRKVYRCYDHQAKNTLKTIPDKTQCPKNNHGESLTIQTSSNLRGSQTPQTPSNHRGFQTPQTPNNPRGSQTPHIPKNPRGSQTPQTPNNLRGSRTPQTPNNPRGSLTPQTPNNPIGSQTPQTPNNPRRSQTPQTPNNPRGSQTPQTPNNPRGSQTPQTPNNPRGSQTRQTPRNLRKRQALQTSNNVGGSQTVLNVMLSNLTGSQNSQTPPNGSQTVNVSKPTNLKIKRTLLKVPVSKLAKSKMLNPSYSGPKSIRKVKLSEILNLEKVQNVLKSTTVLTQQNDSKGQKPYNAPKGFSIPLKVTSEPFRCGDR